jgi:hypothetical protein
MQQTALVCFAAKIEKAVRKIWPLIGSCAELLCHLLASPHVFVEADRSLGAEPPVTE